MQKAAVTTCMQDGNVEQHSLAREREQHSRDKLKSELKGCMRMHHAYGDSALLPGRARSSYGNDHSEAGDHQPGHSVQSSRDALDAVHLQGKAMVPTQDRYSERTNIRQWP